MKLKSLLVAGALATSLVGVGATPASAQDPCYMWHPLEQPVQWAICWVHFLTK